MAPLIGIYQCTDCCTPMLMWLFISHAAMREPTYYVKCIFICSIESLRYYFFIGKSFNYDTAVSVMFDVQVCRNSCYIHFGLSHFLMHAMFVYHMFSEPFLWCFMYKYVQAHEWYFLLSFSNKVLWFYMSSFVLSSKRGQVSSGWIFIILGSSNFLLCLKSVPHIVLLSVVYYECSTCLEIPSINTCSKRQFCCSKTHFCLLQKLLQSGLTVASLNVCLSKHKWEGKSSTLRQWLWT